MPQFPAILCSSAIWLRSMLTHSHNSSAQFIPHEIPAFKCNWFTSTPKQVSTRKKTLYLGESKGWLFSNCHPAIANTIRDPGVNIEPYISLLNRSVRHIFLGSQRRKTPKSNFPERFILCNLLGNNIRNSSTEHAAKFRPANHCFPHAIQTHTETSNTIYCIQT